MTCHAEGWDQYGREMARTFAERWPKEVTLDVYAEGFELDISAENVTRRELPEWHHAWKLRHAGNLDAHGRNKARFGRIARSKNKNYDYRRDCVRFSHKIAAITDAAERAPAERGWLIMVDADVITHETVTTEWISSLITDPSFYLAWLDRVSWYPECGFVIFNETHQAHQWFMARLRAVYENDSVFTLQETHDSFVLQELVKHAVKRGAFAQPVSLSGREGRKASHPFVFSRLAERLDHAKGKFKNEGRTPRGYVKRREAYWA